MVHFPTLMDHYSSVWKALNPDDFAIVITDNYDQTKSDGESLLGYAAKNEYEVIKAEQALQQNLRFDYVITNHPISGNLPNSRKNRIRVGWWRTMNRLMISFGFSKRWKLIDEAIILPLQIGEGQIRFMYGADLSDGWSLQSWNEIYDWFLCHGVNDQRIISERFKGKTFIMGYPRYDAFFDPDLDVSSVREEFEFEENKRTLLWMPTLGCGHSSVPMFAESVASLFDRFNVVVRPHPMSFEQEPEIIEQLESLGFQIDRNATRNMNRLFKVVDLVLADHGGTPFSAIFLGKNLLLLDDPDAAELWINKNSTVSDLRQTLPCLGPREVESLPSLLGDQEFWLENTAAVNALFEQFFGGFRGGGSERVANFLKGIDTHPDGEPRNKLE